MRFVSEKGMVSTYCPFSRKKRMILRSLKMSRSWGYSAVQALYGERKNGKEIDTDYADLEKRHHKHNTPPNLFTVQG